MARFIVKSIISTITTMLIVSVILFGLLEVSGDKDALVEKILGVFVTPEQNLSFQKQLGLDRPAWVRYSDWLIGNSWRADERIGFAIDQIPTVQTGELEWWAIDGDEYKRWEINDDGDLVSIIRAPDGSANTREINNDLWKTDENGEEFFWGIDIDGRGAKWLRNSGDTAFVTTQTGWQELSGAPTEYLPLSKGLIRGDAGTSMKTQRPVSNTLPTRIRNTAVLAGTAFVIVMPLALFLGIIAGINEGKFIDRLLSVFGLAFTATPEFVVGVFLILLIGVYWSVRWLPTMGLSPELQQFLTVPAITLFTSDDVIFTKVGPFTLPNLRIIFLPVITLTLAELGYIIRMTRASMVEVMNTPYIRTAIIKGLPYRRVVTKHAVRNALFAPITIIMLHINYLVGGVVVVESIFGYPGLGSYIYEASIFGDFAAVEAAAMVTVLIAIATRLIGDFIYTLLNPRIRYS